MCAGCATTSIRPAARAADVEAAPPAAGGGARAYHSKGPILRLRRRGGAALGPRKSSRVNM